MKTVCKIAMVDGNGKHVDTVHMSRDGIYSINNHGVEHWLQDTLIRSLKIVKLNNMLDPGEGIGEIIIFNLVCNSDFRRRLDENDIDYAMDDKLSPGLISFIDDMIKVVAVLSGKPISHPGVPNTPSFIVNNLYQCVNANENHYDRGISLLIDLVKAALDVYEANA